MLKFFRFLSGVITGAAVGALLVLLFTPKSGADFQEDIKSFALKSMEDIKAAASEKRIELEKQLSELRKPASQS